MLQATKPFDGCFGQGQDNTTTKAEGKSIYTLQTSFLYHFKRSFTNLSLHLKLESMSLCFVNIGLKSKDQVFH